MALVCVALLVASVLIGTGTLIVIRRGGALPSRERHTLEDRLTGVGNRHALFRSGTVLLTAARHADRPAALLLMGLDGVASIDDLHGPEASRRVLVAFARMAHDYLPPTSLVCRIEGEDFAAVVPGVDPVRARSIADEIRSLFAHLAIDGPKGAVRSTVSIGVVPYDGMTEPDMADLLARASRCLDAAKAGGRNRVVTELHLGRMRPEAGTAPLVTVDERWSAA